MTAAAPLYRVATMPGLIPTLEREGVRVATSRMMATNVTVLRAGREALVVDAPYFPDELAELPAFAGARDVRLFATHSHFDHLLARFAYPHATLIIGRSTAEALAAAPDAPSRVLATEDARVYVTRDRPLLFGALRGVSVPDWLDVGPHAAELVEAAGHAADGTALWAPWEGVLCCGDYLSDVEIPWLAPDGSRDAYRATLERLAPYVDRARLVVPGHGTPCSGEEARRRLEADLRYLDALGDADPGQPLPAGRDTPRQREIHRANVKRAAGKGAPGAKAAAATKPAQKKPARAKSKARKPAQATSGARAGQPRAPDAES